MDPTRLLASPLAASGRGSLTFGVTSKAWDAEASYRLWQTKRTVGEVAGTASAPWSDPLKVTWRGMWRLRF